MGIPWALEVMIAFPFYKGIAEGVLHEIVIFLAACLFHKGSVAAGLLIERVNFNERDTDGVIFVADDRGIIPWRDGLHNRRFSIIGRR